MTESATHFDRLYAQSADPWHYDSRWYEQRKRALVMAALPNPRYARAFEPACGNGALTAVLAGRCDRLVAGDASARAAELARDRLRDCPHVSVSKQALPRDWPDDGFDLILLSELLYYLPAAATTAIARLVDGALDNQGTLALCHWKRGAPDRLQETAPLHAAFGKIRGLSRVAHHDEPDFLLDVWTRGDPSVAMREGLA
jgi:protein-L-isoaspartate O-methyltransferase